MQNKNLEQEKDLMKNNDVASADPTSPEEAHEVSDVLVIGAGFAGLYSVHRARQKGLSVQAVEAGEDVGGTWYWNRYPGARCDVESIDYSYSFDAELQREWRWKERYATQAQIREYLGHVADRFDLRGVYAFSERISSLTYDRGVWTATSESGRSWRARHVVGAVGCLSAVNKPDIPGFDDFAGEVLYTGSWPEQEPDLRGKRVGVIGTGSSGIQLTPVVAEQAGHLTVFQRSPNFSVPASNRPLEDEEWKQLQESYQARRAKSAYAPAGTPHEPYPKDIFEVDEEERRQAFEERWQQGGVLFSKTFATQFSDMRANDLARDFAVAKIRSVVDDPAVADDLIPTDHPIGSKRICTDSNYYQTFNRDNVRLVNLRKDPIVEITAEGIRTEQGEHPLDVLIMATGFDAMTGAVTRMNVTTADGRRLNDLWADGPVTYLGFSVPGFPNLHLLNGPGSPAVLANMSLTAEQQTEWVIDLIVWANEHHIDEVDARLDIARAWSTHVNEVAHRGLFVKANSWYLGSNIEGKKRVFMPYAGGFGNYRRTCDEVAEQGYRGYITTTFSSAEVAGREAAQARNVPGEKSQADAEPVPQ